MKLTDAPHPWELHDRPRPERQHPAANHGLDAAAQFASFLGQTQPVADGEAPTSMAYTRWTPPTPVPETRIPETVADGVHTRAPELHLRLHPEALGDVTVRVAVHDTMVMLHMQAATPRAVQALRDSVASLRLILSDHGLSLKECTVEGITERTDA